MRENEHITHVRFFGYKSFRNYSLSLNHFNVLVGPNNAGKSTILGAFRILSEAMRKARSRNPTLIPGPEGETKGYEIDLQNIPVATENVFFDYDDSHPARVRYKISNGNELLLFFPEQGRCYMICETKGRPVTSTATFKSQYNVSIGFVPILGPVEHNEPLYQEEAARLALLTHRASRNFRNIWYHYPKDFDKFRNLIHLTWPGMDINKPEIDTTHDKILLRMFCPEERIPREIFWAGFGFQVWCQMLTHIVKGCTASLFIIDEPDIYLHADIQRQLLGILKTLGPDIMIATHSTEIITEADPDDLLVINKKFQSAKRIKDPTQLQQVFQILGSNLNPILTQLAKSRRALFVEGKDFQILSNFARKLGRPQVANRTDFAVIPVEGFNPSKVHDFLLGMKKTIGREVLAGVVFDRDYRSTDECKKELSELRKYTVFAHIHNRKEIENFLLVPLPLQRAIEFRLKERRQRTGKNIDFNENITNLLEEITAPLRYRVEAKYLARRRMFEKAKKPGIDESTIDEQLMAEFEKKWADPTGRYLLVPGKNTLTALNTYLQTKFKITVSAAVIIKFFHKEEIPREMVALVDKIDEFSKQPVHKNV